MTTKCNKRKKRPQKYGSNRLDMALSLRDQFTMSEIAYLTGISESTLYRHLRNKQSD